jgi:hypothetical protein
MLNFIFSAVGEWNTTQNVNSGPHKSNHILIICSCVNALRNFVHEQRTFKHEDVLPPQGKSASNKRLGDGAVALKGSTRTRQL